MRAAEIALFDLATMMLDGAPDARIAAANELGKILDPLTIDALIGALHDEVFDVRAAAGLALVAFGERAIIPLAKLARESANRGAVEMAHLALERIPGAMTLLDRAHPLPEYVPESLRAFRNLAAELRSLTDEVRTWLRTFVDPPDYPQRSADIEELLRRLRVEIEADFSPGDAVPLGYAMHNCITPLQALQIQLYGTSANVASFRRFGSQVYRVFRASTLMMHRAYS